jgi:hypothetical protein
MGLFGVEESDVLPSDWSLDSLGGLSSMAKDRCPITYTRSHGISIVHVALNIKR